MGSPLTKRSVLKAVFAYTVLALALQLHGFSWGRWATLLEKPELDPSWIGRARGVRADDFTVSLPTIFSQIRQHPAFPEINPALGLHTDMRLTPCPVPLRHWTLFFKPQLWGYGISADFGMSWQWQAYAVGLFLSTFFALLRLGGGWVPAALALSLAFVFAPFNQFWSYLPSHFFTFGWLIFLGVDWLHRAPGFKERAAASGLVLWSAMAFALWIYPPFQLPIALGVAALCAACVVHRVQARGISAYARQVLPFEAGIAAVVSFLLFTYLREVAPIVKAMTETVYPGQRAFYGGGGLSAQLLVGNTVFAPLLRNLGPIVGNLCEGAGFLLSFPLALAAWRLKILRTPASGFLAAVALYAAFLLSWEFWGFSKTLCEILGLTRMVPGRTTIGYGFIDVVVLGSLIRKENKTPTGRIGGPALAWAAVYAFLVWHLVRLAPDQALTTAAFSVFSLALTLSLLKKPLWFAWASAMAMVASTWLFNPVASGGYRTLMQGSELMRAVSELRASGRAEDGWISMGGEAWSDLLRSVGVRTLDGTFFTPQWELWKTLDPKGQWKNVYNRYAEVSFQKASSEEPVRMTTPIPNAVLVEVDLEKEPFLSLPFRYLLLSAKNEPGSASRHYRLVRRIAEGKGLSIWEKVR